jgi:hypothetical protein
MIRLFSVLLAQLLFISFAHAQECENMVAYTNWYCADIRGCTNAKDESDNTSPAQCYPPGDCEDMGTDVSTEYRVTEDEADEDTNTDVSCTKECRIVKTRKCLE